MCKFISLTILILSISTGLFAQTSLDCPTISVTTTVGIVLPGEVLEFVGSLNGQIPPTVSYSWTTNYGEIISGQNTLYLKVRLPKGFRGGNVVGTLTLSGLTEGCPNTEREIFSEAIDPGPTLAVEYRGIYAAKSLPRLQSAAKKLRDRPNDFLVIIIYYATENRASKKSIAKVNRYLIHSLKIPKNDFRIITAIEEPDYTKVFLVPPGVDIPQP
ncbi:MAG: hypothetical protein ABI878_08025 [Acidobacteriota bacterium]